MENMTNNSEQQIQETETEQGKSNREAAKYRVQLRNVEEERDKLRDQLALMQKNQIEKLSEEKGVKPAALWASGVELQDFLDEDGNLDPDKMQESIKQARETLGIPEIPRAPGAGVQGNMGSDIPGADETPTPTWGSLLSPNERGNK